MNVNYEAPAVQVMDLELEGVLCSSVTPNSLEGMVEGNEIGEGWL